MQEHSGWFGCKKEVSYADVLYAPVKRGLLKIIIDWVFPSIIIYEEIAYKDYNISSDWISFKK